MQELEICSQSLVTLKISEFNVSLATIYVGLTCSSSPMCEAALKSGFSFYLGENLQYFHYMHMCAFVGSQVGLSFSVRHFSDNGRFFFDE